MEINAGKKIDESYQRHVYEGDLGELVGLQHILCDAVGKKYSKWPELMFVFTKNMFFFKF